MCLSVCKLHVIFDNFEKQPLEQISRVGAVAETATYQARIGGGSHSAGGRKHDTGTQHDTRAPTARTSTNSGTGQTERGPDMDAAPRSAAPLGTLRLRSAVRQSARPPASLPPAYRAPADFHPAPSIGPQPPEKTPEALCQLPHQVVLHIRSRMSECVRRVCKMCVLFC
jgi:hypothetical protein